MCTSGTAAANFLPAVIEAQESGVPLLVCTADRPPEMRECASGQAIDQQKLYGDYVTFYHELAVPEAAVDRLQYVRQAIVHAFERTQSPGCRAGAPEPAVSGSAGAGVTTVPDLGIHLVSMVYISSYQNFHHYLVLHCQVSFYFAY